MVPDELYCIGDLVRLSEELFFSYDLVEPIRKAHGRSAYYAIGMKRTMLGIVVSVYHHDQLADPDLWLPYNFIYRVWWTGGVGIRRERHEDLILVSKS